MYARRSRLFAWNSGRECRDAREGAAGCYKNKMTELLTVVLCALIIASMGFIGFLFREERKLLRQIRKMAALYPPYMPAETDMEVLDQTSVKITDDWTDLGPGRD